MDSHLPVAHQATARAHTPDDPRLAQTMVGAWWAVRDAEDPLAQGVDPIPAHGVVLPIVAVHRIDGSIHSIDLHRHPRAGTGTVRLRLDDLWARCTPAPQGGTARLDEQNALLQEIGASHARLAAGPTDAQIAQMAIAAQPRTQTNADMATSPDTAAQATPSAALPAALTGGRDTRALARGAQDAVALAQARARWAADVSQDMGRLGAILGRFQHEQVAVLQAQADASTAEARTALERLDTLTLFLGERQKVTTLVAGESAPSDAPLHFYQQMLYLDEELAVAWPDPEGFTWKTGIDSLGTILAQHPAIVARMLPQPRSVAIARVRRHPRPLPDMPREWSAIFRIVEEQEWDKALLILVRDGSRVHMIEADADTAGAERLFPSRAEIDALYREKGWGRGTPIAITPEDLAYVESRAAHAQRALFYKRFLVLFWGLHAREGLFGPFMPTDANWFDPNVQEAFFRFVHDEEMGLAAPEQPVVAWMQEGLRQAGVGTRVAVDTRVALESGILINGYADVDHRRLKGMAKTGFLITAVESDGLDRHITLPMLEGKKTVLRRMPLTQEGWDCAPRGVVVLDDLTTATIDTRLDSRRDRQAYADYVPLLRWLRPAVQEAEAALGAELGIDVASLEQQAWKAARRALKGGRATRMPAMAKAYAQGLAAAEKTAPALVDPKGQAHPLAPWAHPAFPGLPTGLWAAGGTVCAAHHPAPNGWVAVGALDKGQGPRLGEALRRVDLPGWLDRIASPMGRADMGSVLEGKDPDAAMALLEAFIAHNRAQRGTRVMPALCTWTLGVGVSQEPEREARLLVVHARRHPVAVAIAAAGTTRVHALLHGFYRDPDAAIARACQEAEGGWWLSIARANPTRPAFPALGLDWDDAWASDAVPRHALDGAPRGQDRGMLWGGAIDRPSSFMWGGPSQGAYEERARTARFWLRDSARAFLAPSFGAERWSQDGISWFAG